MLDKPESLWCQFAQSIISILKLMFSWLGITENKCWCEEQVRQNHSYCHPFEVYSEYKTEVQRE